MAINQDCNVLSLCFYLFLQHANKMHQMQQGFELSGIDY